MKKFMLILCISTCSYASAQWKLGTEILRTPDIEGGASGGFAYINRYDTIPCMYVTNKDTLIHRGWRVVYVRDGYYTDRFTINKPETYRVFYDDKRRRIDNVLAYYFYQ